MAKGKYHEWLTPEGLLLIEGWAWDGLTDEQIAHNIGIDKRTLHRWKNEHPTLLSSLKKGKEVIDRQVENALLQSALGFQYDEQTVTNKGDIVTITYAISKVVPHKHWTGKNCPQNLLKSWGSFIKLVKNSDTQPAPYDNNPEYHRLLALESPMMRGADIKRLQQRLQSKVIDGIFGPATESDVLNWQRLHDEKGNVVAPGSSQGARKPV